MSAPLNPSPQADREPFLGGFSPRTLTRMAFALLLVGLLWRTVRYMLQFPIWGDEAMLGTNFVLFDYGTLTQRLEFGQVAPLLFLWGERTAWLWFGPGELSMRLLPFLAGTASLLLYYRLTGLILNPQARLIAVGFLAVAIWPVSMSTLLKPYSFDLLMALVLLLPAVQWFQAPERTRWLIVLTLLTPLALLGSYPAVFVAGGISLALLRPAWQHGWRSRCWFAAYNLTLLAGFLVVCHVGSNQLNVSLGTTTAQEGMNTYWGSAFPPASPLAFLPWFILRTTGQMAAYPVGAVNGGSTLTVLCCLVGAACWARQRRGGWLILFGAPLFLNLVAAMLHRYPYGAACRLSQHLAPAFCLTAGLGVAALINRASRRAGRRAAWTAAVAGLFALLGVGGLLTDVVHPYREARYVWSRATMKQMHNEIPAADPVVICGKPLGVDAIFTWYWLNEGDRVSWNFQVPAEAQAGGQVWGFYCGDRADAACRRLTRELSRRDPSWKLVKRIPYSFQPQTRKEEPQGCELFCFARFPSTETVAGGN
jgi:hypothetical protein